MTEGIEFEGESSIQRDVVASFVGNIGYAAAQWCVLLGLTRIGSASVVGEYALALAVGAPVVMFTNLRLATLLAADGARTASFREYFGVRYAATLVAIVAIAVIAFAMGFTGPAWWTVFWIGVAKGAEALSDLMYGYLAFRLHFRAVAMSLLIRGWITVAWVVAAMLAHLNIATVSAGIAVLWIGCSVILDAKLIQRAARGDDERLAPPAKLCSLFRLARPSPALVRMAIGALPMGVVAVALSLIASIPRVSLNAALGPASVGYFVVLSYAVVAMRMVALALGGPVIPRLARFAAARDATSFRSSVRRLLALGFGLGAAGVVGSAFLGEAVLGIVYGSAYAAYGTVMTWLLVNAALGFLAQFLQDAILVLGQLRELALLLVAALAVVTLTQPLVGRFGMKGAALSLLCGSAVELLGAWWIYSAALRRFFSVSPNRS